MAAQTLPADLSDDDIESLLADLIDEWGDHRASDPSRPWVAEVLEAHGLRLCRAGPGE